MPLNSNQLKQIILAEAAPNESLQGTVKIILSNISNLNENSILQSINILLSNAKTRLRGFELISEIIPHCSPEVLSQHAINWANHCITRHSSDSIKLKTLFSILQNCRNVENFQKKFLAECLPNTVKSCLAAQNNSEKIWALKCLTECMKLFPSWFGNHKSKIESFLVKFIESASTDDVREAAVAFHCLQQTGPAGVEGTNYVFNFHAQFNKLCATVQALYNIFFENVTEMDSSEPLGVEPFSLSTIPSHYSSVKTIQTTCNRILNCIKFIKTMIARKYPVVKQIVPKYVIDVISRGLSTHLCLKDEDSIESTAVSLCLSEIQIENLQLLKILMKWNFPSVLPFSFVVTKVIINTVKRLSMCDCFTLNTSYQEQAYKALYQWISLTKNATQSHMQETLFPILLKEISPNKKKVLLNSNIKKGKKRANEGTNEKNIYLNGELRKSRCKFSLEILKCLLSTSSVNNESLLKETVQFIVKALNDVQTGRSVAPLDDFECQAKLYEVLVAFFKQDCVKIFPPIHLAINILSKGLNTNAKVLRICEEGLDLLEKISQPVCPSLSILDEEKQVISTSDLMMITHEDDEEERIVEETESNETEEHEHNEDKEYNTTEYLKPPLESNGHFDLTADSPPAEEEEHLEPPLENNSHVDLTADSPLAEDKEDLEEPPIKKIKPDDHFLDEMLSSFQDVVQ